ncbi:MAG: hypothetical protein HWN65_18300 [Candidatus Helarchaeota archaeon]|nr:hypothetical protein [Candidatus Helarchaeota archaeon]
MAQKKTVFERLEDKMIELEKKLYKKFSDVQASIDNLKEEIPRSLGQSLMSFTDMLGAKVEDLEDLIKNTSGTGGPAPDSSVLNKVQDRLNEIKAGMNDLKTAIQNIKIHPSPAVTSTAAARKPATAKPVSTPARAVSLTPPSTPSTAPSVGGTIGEVLNVLDLIKQKAQSGITAPKLAIEMEEARDKIVKIYRWHPALYELATFARRLKKQPEGSGVDAEHQNLLLEKINEWKNRIRG